MKTKYNKLLNLIPNKESFYKKTLKFKDKLGNEIDLPKKTESRIEFFNRVKLDLKKLEGGSTLQHKYMYDKIINEKFKKKNNVKIILDIGFNAGASAEYFLETFPNAIVYSFDIMIHKYIRYAKMWIDVNYPGRHILIGGDSTHTVPNFYKHHKLTCDLIFIDGNHLFDYAFKDIKNMKNFSNKNTLVLLDNIAPHRGCSREVYYAFREHLDNNNVLFDNYYELEEFRDAFLTFYYNFENKKSKPLPIKKMERLVKLYQLLSQFKINKNNKNKIIQYIENNDIPQREINYIKKYIKI
jgi:predicted O-methyltransferase YrrM